MGTSRGAGNILWKKEYIETFLDLVNEYESTILGVFAGHIHRDMFNLIYKDGSYDKDKDPLAIQMISSAVTPKEFNNPAFRVVNLTSSMTFSDFHQFIFHMETNQWHEFYSFSKLSGGEQPDVNGLLAAYKSMRKGKWPPGEFTDSVCNYQDSIWAGDGEIWDDVAELPDCWNLMCSFTELFTGDLDDCAKGLDENDVCPSAKLCST